MKTTPEFCAKEAGPPKTADGELDRKAVSKKVGNAMKALADIAKQQKAAKKG